MKKKVILSTGVLILTVTLIVSTFTGCRASEPADATTTTTTTTAASAEDWTERGVNNTTETTTEATTSTTSTTKATTTKQTTTAVPTTKRVTTTKKKTSTTKKSSTTEKVTTTKKKTTTTTKKKTTTTKKASGSLSASAKSYVEGKIKTAAKNNGMTVYATKSSSSGTKLEMSESNYKSLASGAVELINDDADCGCIKMYYWWVDNNDGTSTLHFKSFAN